MDLENGSAPGAEQDPAAAFLEQHHQEIEGIEREQEAGEIPGSEAVQSQGLATGELIGEVDAVNGDPCQENGADACSVISQADQLHQEPDSIRKWREEQIKHLAELDAHSREAELEWREKAKKDLEDWYIQQAEHLEEMKTNNRSAEDPDVSDSQEVVVGSEWEHVLHLCDLSSKTSKVSKDVSRMRSVLMSLSQVPLTLK